MDRYFGQRTSRPATLLPIFAALAFSLLVTTVLVLFRETLARLGGWGYVGAFLVQLFNGASIVFPAVGPAFIVAFATSLNPLLLGIVGGLGAAVGETTGYLVGAGGRQAVKETGLYLRLHRLTEQWTGLSLFVFAATPLPFDIAGIWAGALHYPLWRFYLWMGIGKIVSTTVLALAGYYGISWLLDIARVVE